MCLRKGKINYWINLLGNSTKNYTQNKNIPYNAKKSSIVIFIPYSEYQAVGLRVRPSHPKSGTPRN